MQAQMQTIATSPAIARGRTTILAVLLGIHVVMHVMWLSLPSFVEGDEVGLAQYIVNSTTLTAGLVALAAIWRGFRWGRWLMIVLTILLAIFTLPEVFFLTGVMRVGSIFAMTGITATMILLFRPEVRNRE